MLDLNRSETYPEALVGVDSVFLLTGYTAEMLFQSKQLIDASKEAGVSHIVHLGVYTDHRNPIPHYTWHDLVETYIKASGIAWTNVHPNVVTESVFDHKPTVFETGTFFSHCGNAPQGWVCTDDIAAVSSKILLDGPEKHNGKDYYLSIDVKTADELAKIFTEVMGREATWFDVSLEMQRQNYDKITDPGIRLYMESAYIVMKLTRDCKYQAQTAICDDVLTVTGKPGTTMCEWAKRMANAEK